MGSHLAPLLHVGLDAQLGEREVDNATGDGNPKRNPQGRKHPKPRPVDRAVELEGNEEYGQKLTKANAGSPLVPVHSSLLG